MISNLFIIKGEIPSKTSDLKFTMKLDDTCNHGRFSYLCASINDIFTYLKQKNVWIGYTAERC